MQITACHSPNTLAHAFRLESGTVVTLFRSWPGDTKPRMQMQVEGGKPVDVGAVEAPERFGPYDTPTAFAAWVENFAASA